MLLAAVALTVTALCPEDATCLEADRIRVVAADPGRAETLLDLALGAQALFEAEFGVAAGPVAVVEDLQTFPGLSIELAEAGYRVKPWISPMAMRQTLEAQIRPVMEQRLSAARLPEAAIDA